MGASPALSRGALALVRFLFSDLSSVKLRPAVVLALLERGDAVLCRVTSRPYADSDAIEITAGSFKEGGLDRSSYARPGKTFAANEPS
jgi:mRNA interferase MazF